MSTNKNVFTIRNTRTDDLTYIKRLNFLTDVFGQEDQPVSPNYDDDFVYYVDSWDPQDGVIAFDAHGIPAGAIWYLRGAGEHHGIKDIAAAYPEIAIAIENRYRGQGLASQLFQALFDQLQTRNIPGCCLFVHKDNPQAQKVYEAKGFYQIGGNDEWNIFQIDLSR